MLNSDSLNGHCVLEGRPQQIMCRCAADFCVRKMIKYCVPKIFSCTDNINA